MTPDEAEATFGDVIVAFDHVAMAAWRIEDALGVTTLLEGSYRNGGDEAGGFRWAQWNLPGAGKLEVIAPLDRNDPDHFLVRFLQDRGPGLHHLTFRVRDLHEAVSRARALGFEVVGVAPDGWWKEAFVHPAGSNGVLIQLAEWSDEDGDHSTSLAELLGSAGE